MKNIMLVNLPNDPDIYEDTGENGMAFFFIIPQKRDFKKRRQVCLAGDLIYPLMDVQIYPNEKQFPNIYHPENWEDRLRDIDGGLLIGSTRQCPFNKNAGEYFHATYEDLTSEGKFLHDTLKRLYGKIIIVTLLDT